MKHDLTTLLEAVRLVRAELARSNAASADIKRAIARISGIMNEPKLIQAIGHLDPASDAPSIVPEAPGTRIH